MGRYRFRLAAMSFAMRTGAYAGRVLCFGSTAARGCDTASAAGEAEEYSEEYT